MEKFNYDPAIKARWSSMVSRCHGTHKQPTSYQRRGITVCNEWRGEKGLMNFAKWSMENGFSSNLCIDRIDTYGNYEPSNCRWATVKVNNLNRRPNENRLTGRFIEYGMSLTRNRLNYGISQREAAKSIGVSPSLICAWERGMKMPSAEYQRKLAKLYKCTEADIAASCAETKEAKKHE